MEDIKGIHRSNGRSISYELLLVSTEEAKPMYQPWRIQLRKHPLSISPEDLVKFQTYQQYHHRSVDVDKPGSKPGMGCLVQLGQKHQRYEYQMTASALDLKRSIVFALVQIGLRLPSLMFKPS